ncbi:MAG: M1 family metallopeptidase [Aggregatilineales bacterium]
MRLSLRVFMLAALLLTTLVVFVPSAAQQSDSAISVYVSVPNADGKPYTFSGTYLGHGVVLTDWAAATFYGLGLGDPKFFESPLRRIKNYVVPAPNTSPNPEYVAFNFVACLVANKGWQPLAPSNAQNAPTPGPNCVPFELASHTTVQRGTDTPLKVKRLLYADQASKIALIELATVPDWPSLRVSNQVTNSLTVGLDWVNDLYGVFINRDDTPLKAVLTDGLIGPSVGKSSIGDVETPELGNTGYDVTHYDLDLHFDVPNAMLNGTATLDIQATYPQLSRFSLDFSTLKAHLVKLDGQTIPFRQDYTAQKLFIDLPQPIAFGQTFKLAIQYGGTLKTFGSRYLAFLPVGLFVDPKAQRVFDVDEPDGAHTWFPCNDHPLDLATFTYHITVNSGLTAVANGQLQGKPATNSDGTRTFTWVMPQPMATYLAVVAIANYDPRPLPGGPGIPLHIYAYAQDADQAVKAYQQTGDIMNIEVARFGSFPFDSYGQVLVPQNSVGMESQTMTVLPDQTAHSIPTRIYTLIGHEMSHHWFGDSLALSAWSEIWLNEGFASYAEYMTLHDSGQAGAATKLLAQWKFAVLDEQAGDPLIAPSPGNMFGTDSYLKAGYVLYMLQEKVGDAAFFKILQTYAARFRYHNVTTDDFWAVAEEVSGQDLAQFFTQWLYETDVPRLQVLWTEQNGKVDGLICTNTTNKATYTVDVPVALTNGAPDILSTPGTPAGSDAETLHVVDSSGTFHFAPGFDVTNWQIDPHNTVLASVAVSQVDKVPAVCPAAAN